MTRTHTWRNTTLLILGAAVVLGALIAVVSSWTDRATADAEFGSGEFRVEVRTDHGQTWQEGGAGDRAARLNFAVSIEGFQPGNAGYVPISLRTDAQSTGGTVTLEPAINRGSGTLFSALRYEVVQLPDEDASCGPGATGSSIVAAGSALDSTSTSPIELGPGGEDPAHLCFAVTLPEQPAGAEGLADLQTTVQWQLTAVGQPGQDD